MADWFKRCLGRWPRPCGPGTWTQRPEWRQPAGRRNRTRSLLSPIVRRILHGWFLASRGLTLGVRGAVLDAEARVFLVRHTYVPGWQLPGGGIEIGEDAVTALRQELFEEAAIEIGPEPCLHGIFYNSHVSRRDHVLVYVVRDFRVLGEKAPDREIAESGFFPLADLPRGTTAGTRARLDEILSGVPRTAFWAPESRG